MPIESMKALLEAGVHFGHRTRRWNPKMKPYIFTERNGIHILDLQQTLSRLEFAYNLVRDRVADGGALLFVGTKKQAQDALSEEAARCEMPYVNQRWLGGTLTNWRTIRQRIDYLLDLEKKQMRGEFARLPKKEVSNLEYEITRLNRRLGGLKEMQRLPSLLFVVDVRREAIAINEANSLNIPVIAMVDTNCDPTQIDHVIPSNDDAIRAIRLIVSKMAEAAIEGLRMREAMMAEEEEEGEALRVEGQERYLGPSTLAKLRAASGESEEEEWSEEDEPEAAATSDFRPEAAHARRRVAERVLTAPVVETAVDAGDEVEVEEEDPAELDTDQPSE
jgi:small subunit ribosomal protein S2